MNRLETYNKVHAHLLNQKRKSAIKDKCLYRSPEGLKCAIGCLIPDELYSKDLDKNDINSSIKYILNDYPLIKEALNIENLEDITFLTELQDVHDIFSPVEWDEQLLKVKNKYVK